MIRAVTFDLDDTIVTADKHVQPGLSHAFHQHRQFFPKLTYEEFLSTNKAATSEIFSNPDVQLSQAGILIWYRMFELLNLEPSPHRVARLYQSLQNYIVQHTSLQPGFGELVDWLRENGVRIGVISNGSFSERINKMKRVGIHRDISVLVSSDLVGKDKPHPRPFRFILRLLAAEPHEVIHVGDSVREDIEGALSLGIVPVLFRPSGEEYDSISVKNIDYRIADHRELISIVENISNTQ